MVYHVADCEESTTTLTLCAVRVALARRSMQPLAMIGSVNAAQGRCARSPESAKGGAGLGGGLDGPSISPSAQPAPFSDMDIRIMISMTIPHRSVRSCPGWPEGAPGPAEAVSLVDRAMSLVDLAVSVVASLGVPQLAHSMRTA